MNSNFIKVLRDDQVGIIKFNRPEKLNAWHTPMRKEIVIGLKAFQNDSGIKAIIVTGEGENAFSAGQDLSETMKFSGKQGTAWLDEWYDFYNAIRYLEKPVVAALNGVAAGSAFQFALQCDIRVGHSGTKMGQPEINSGIPSTLGTWLLMESLGKSRAVELILTGRMMDADECYRIGLIHHMVSQYSVIDKAKEIALDLARKPPLAMALNKRHLRALSEAAFQNAIESGRTIQGQAYESGEPQSMMAEFLAKRAERKTTFPSKG